MVSAEDPFGKCFYHFPPPSAVKRDYLIKTITRARFFKLKQIHNVVSLESFKYGLFIKFF